MEWRNGGRRGGWEEREEGDVIKRNSLTSHAAEERKDGRGRDGSEGVAGDEGVEGGGGSSRGGDLVEEATGEGEEAEAGVGGQEGGKDEGIGGEEARLEGEGVELGGGGREGEGRGGEDGRGKDGGDREEGFGVAEGVAEKIEGLMVASGGRDVSKAEGGQVTATAADPNSHSSLGRRVAA